MRAVTVAVCCAVVAITCAPPGTERGTALAAAMRGWERAGLDSGECLGGTRVIWAETPEVFEARCKANSATLSLGRYEQTGAACLTRWRRGIVGQRNGWLITLAPGQPIEDNGDPIIHEAMHALIYCARLSTRIDPYDSQHALPQVWAANGQDTAQAYAWEAYSE
jgi:hypothetical protein